ncbi:restriction endonuclease [Streptomyces olivaceiscleroticus]|uniref:Restriction endonuclease type IV Mrr domain-containing protein n=1 Tax=Streptomyces olivaceiscleroticus TaxID=68245 RepID=A0ABN1BMW7_9ACTN
MTTHLRRLYARAGEILIGGITYWLLLDAVPLFVITVTVLAAAVAGTWAVRHHGQRWAQLLPRVRGGVQTIPLPRPRRTYDHTLAAYQAMEPTAFEHAIADLARRDQNVTSATVQGGSNDRALDVLVSLADGRRIAIQCKRYGPTNRVPAGVIYEVNGTYRDYHRCQVGIIVTTSGFTRDATLANASLDQPLRLIDGRALTRWAGGGRPPWG